MKKTTIYIAILLATMVSSCKKDSFTVSGTIQNGANKTLYIEEMSPKERIFLDSIRLDAQGHFEYTYKAPYESFYNIHDSENDYIMLIPQNGENIELTANYGALAPTYTVRGSEHSIEIWKLITYCDEGNETLIDIVAQDNANRKQYAGDNEGYKTAKQHTDSLYWSLYKTQSEYVKNFINENYGSLSTLIALYKPLGANHALIDLQRDVNELKYYDIVLKGLEEKIPDNPHTIHFKQTVDEMHTRLSLPAYDVEEELVKNNEEEE